MSGVRSSRRNAVVTSQHIRPFIAPNAVIVLLSVSGNLAFSLFLQTGATQFSDVRYVRRMSRLVKPDVRMNDQRKTRSYDRLSCNRP